MLDEFVEWLKASRSNTDVSWGSVLFFQHIQRLNITSKDLCIKINLPDVEMLSLWSVLLKIPSQDLLTYIVVLLIFLVLFCKRKLLYYIHWMVVKPRILTTPVNTKTASV